MQFFRPFAEAAQQEALQLVPNQNNPVSSEPQPLDEALLALVSGGRKDAPGSGW